MSINVKINNILVRSTLEGWPYWVEISNLHQSVRFDSSDLPVIIATLKAIEKAIEKKEDERTK